MDPKDHISTGPTDPAEGAPFETDEMKPPDPQAEATENRDAKSEDETDGGSGDGVPRTYSSNTKEGEEKTGFGGSQGGD